ncbi:hypothetical protein JG687_00002948 [Phytophthora cactorum]|uniref:START-like domain n=1 Tax=Phytophthora cactorum TaxID=29920 RepID=A0A329SW66_9STRA|nr:hypothetical protein Pcac1_g6017 [Phytophthora cactorum]KAG2808700.1 hypothetical protein PC112_g16856 [Phytophthora cactorum]KAG2810363.1 hypothetical protein PC111_g15683 [Phytophthora cactorum]KAG2850364.1 hypothetical protein PC113_g16842 [Phytophthora cactorum]KAG2888601.1 hypothetical protein PC114_g18352 [Phytophthora cactorum]
MVDVGRPPVSNGLVSNFTLEMGDEGSDPLLHSLNDVTAARLRRYHQQCNKRLDATLQLFRERQERERRSRFRISRSPLNLPSHQLPRTSSPGRLAASEARQWKLLRESSDIRVYRLKTRQQRTCTVQAIGTVHGSLGDVMNGLYADSTRTARVLQMLLSPRSLDARVLQVDKSSTETKPFQFSGIVWMALKLPGLGFCRHRDFVCFKKMDVVKDELGEDMGYMVLHSIDPLADEIAVSSFDTNAPTGATWPPVSQGHQNRSRSASSAGFGSGHFVRGFISLAIVFKRLGDDRVAMFAHGQFNPSGRLSPLLGDNCIAEWLTSMANTVQSGQAKNLSLLLVGQKQTTADHSSSRQRCGVCARSLFFWDAPRSCRGCWKVCCRTCRVTKPIFCAHYHANGGNTAANVTSGPCTETFCLACVCAVIPSGATINARLIKRLAKKRKRAPTFFRPTITASSITDGSIRQQQPPPKASEHAERLLAAAEMSSISVLSSRESEKYQQHRLSLNARPKKRANVQPEITGHEAEEDEDVDTPSTMLEVLEHYQVRRRGSASIVSGVSSSNAGTSLRSFTSADLASTSTAPFNSFQLGRYPSGHSLLAHNHSFHQRIGVPATRPGQVQGHVSMERRGSNNFQAQSSFWLPRQSALVKKPKDASPPLDDEYYQRLLQNYLLHTNSSRSLASAFSMSSYGGKSTATFTVPQPPISQESNVVSEPQSEPPSDARAASNCSSPRGSSLLLPDGVIYRRFK